LSTDRREYGTERLQSHAMSDTVARLPTLRPADWADTCATLHMWSQMVGKVRLALAPPENHWWHVTLYVTSRGLTTSVMPFGDDRFVEIAFDFVDHELVIATNHGKRVALALVPQTVADFYGEFTRALHACGVNARIWPMPVEVPSPIRFDQDHVHGAYDRAAVERWFRVLLLANNVLEEFRGRFIGKCSPVHFFWGSFDLAVTRFNGRRAPQRAGADAVTREAYSHEVISAGFWPGVGMLDDAAFYAYAAPEPEGCKEATVLPASAGYHRGLNEFLLPFEDVRAHAAPHDAILAFLQSTYDVSATLGGWDRAALERG
jgi:hypothetical protein